MNSVGAADLPIGGLGAIGLGMKRDSRGMSMHNVADEHAAGEAQSLVNIIIL